MMKVPISLTNHLISIITHILSESCHREIESPSRASFCEGLFCVYYWEGGRFFEANWCWVRFCGFRGGVGR